MAAVKEHIEQRGLDELFWVVYAAVKSSYGGEALYFNF
ncbi:hypothetical protein AvCA_05710 [Azotobacter vinelandii CA]|uniref:Uncharacterized protein n=2 Tax=Azotobacter vinelandii TaxID=354 RepID=C1DKG1_AZOVD|nr:hypothetical protein Avin_05710 [Azotobacter vinelandii DJ]AGK15572.1 hypothetical protein AvCA_05710 [Azotobacter vinelandii CA]AGK19396.1 hypothetical protein AvCA6_05710 [Azotobacter vinelandii CA6]